MLGFHECRGPAMCSRQCLVLVLLDLWSYNLYTPSMMVPEPWEGSVIQVSYVRLSSSLKLVLPSFTSCEFLCPSPSTVERNFSVISERCPNIWLKGMNLEGSLILYLFSRIIAVG